MTASEATNAFNEALWDVCESSVPAFAEVAEPLKDSLFKATFDARVFSVPERDVANYFVWRQQDAIRNAIASLGQAHFSAKELHGKSTEDIKEMLDRKSKSMSPHDAFITWEAQPDDFKQGFMIWGEERQMSPAVTFSDSQFFFENMLAAEEE